MTRQNVTLWKPNTCDCEFYIRLDEQGDIVFLDYEEVKAEQQKRIAAKDPAVNPILCHPHKICPRHATQGHKLGQNLVTVIKEEQARKRNKGGVT